MIRPNGINTFGKYMMTPSEIAIRPLVLEDIERHHAAVVESTEALAQWMPWCHAGYSIEDSRGWIESQVKAFSGATEYTFAIVDPDDRMLGSCGLNHIDELNLHANLGYWVRTSCLGRGVATLAVKLLADWAFANTDLKRLEILAALENNSSQRVAERAGATREGTLRSRLKLNGLMHDAIMYAIIRPNSNQPIHSTEPTAPSVTKPESKDK
jgi:RimJ/RimL family protein N-acetyltransferase